MKEELKQLKEKYNKEQLIACVASRELREGEHIFAGVGLAMLPAAIAQIIYYPNNLLTAESGFIGMKALQTLVSPADLTGATVCNCYSSLPQVFYDQQCGYLDVGYLGLAQTDKYGNVNTTAIFGSGDFYHPDVRMNGSGGGNDVASSAGRVVYVIPMREKGQFLKKVDFITEPGFLDGTPGARERAGLVGKGPSCVVTDRGIFRFDPETHEMYLSEVYPGTDEEEIEEIKKRVEWDLKVAKELGTIDPPTDKEFEILKLMDPGGTWSLPSIFDTPAVKILLAGRLNLDGYSELAQRYESSWKTVLEM